MNEIGGVIGIVIGLIGLVIAIAWIALPFLVCERLNRLIKLAEADAIARQRAIVEQCNRLDAIAKSADATAQATAALTMWQERNSR